MRNKRDIYFVLSQNLKSKEKLSGHWPELPGKVISFHIVPLDPAYKAGLAGHVPAKIQSPNFKGIPKPQYCSSRPQP